MIEGLHYRRALLLTLATLVAFFAPHVARGRVLHPHDNAAEVGHRVRRMDASTRIFADQCTLYVPEIQAHLTGARSGWIATWNPHNELGRPLFATGIGSAFVVGHVLSKLTDDALWFYTWMAILAVCGTALFAFGFLRELALHPVACATGALGISVGPLFPAWQAVPLVQWGYCWAFAALWAIERSRRRPTPANWIAVAFAVHAALLTGFLQHVILLGWIVAGWIVLGARGTRGPRARHLLSIFTATLVGVLSVLPVYLDLWVDWQRSTRADWVVGAATTFGASFWLDLVGLLRENAPGSRSLSLSTVYAGLVAIALLGAGDRSVRYWVAWAALLFTATVSPVLSEGLRFLGLTLSDWSPAYGGLLPCAVLAAVGVDRVLRSPTESRRLPALVSLAPLAVGGGALALGAGVEDLRAIGVAVGLGLGATIFAASRRVWVLLALLVASVFLDGRALVRWQPRSEVRTDSVLARRIRHRTADGSRFAWVGPPPTGFRFLPSNMEMMLGISSLHTYDHFVSRAFDAWARPLEQRRRDAAYDRRFERISEARLLSRDALAFAGISLLLSTRDLDTDLARERERFGVVRLLTVNRRGPLEAHLAPGGFATSEPGEVEVGVAAVRAGGVGARRVLDEHDRLRFQLRPVATESLLFVSQQHHPHWRARAGGRALEVVRVNGLYLGVVVPAGTAEVELAFEPWIRWSIVPQVLFVLAGAFTASAGLRRRRRQAVARENARTASITRV